MAILTLAPVRRMAIDAKVAIAIDATNANPRHLEVYEMCLDLDDKELKYVLKQLRLFKRSKEVGHG